MTLLYSWKKILRKAGHSSKSIVNALHYLLDPSPMMKHRNHYYKRFYGYDFSGYSFLRNPYDLIAARYKYTDKEIADYLGLASFRNLADYKAFGKTTLDLDISPLPREKLLKNRLLRIENDQVHFLFEDYT